MAKPRVNLKSKDNPTGRWTAIPDAFFDAAMVDHRLTPADTKVLIMLLHLVLNFDSLKRSLNQGVPYPFAFSTLDELGNRCRLHPKSVAKSLAKLAKTGYLKQERRGSVYLFRLPLTEGDMPVASNPAE